VPCGEDQTRRRELVVGDEVLGNAGEGEGERLDGMEWSMIVHVLYSVSKQCGEKEKNDEGAKENMR
jgi:hypothetical protein